MKTNNPACTDFIVAAIREVRPKTHGVKRGAAAGVNLKKIFNITTTVYSAKEFTQALDKLLQDGTVILSAMTYTWSERGENNTNYSRGEVIRLSQAPSEDRCAENDWWEDGSGKLLQRPITAVSGRAHKNIRLHIIADGLPDRIAGLVSNSPLNKQFKTVAIATRILEKLRKKQ